MLHILRPAVWEFPHFFVFFLHSSMHSPTRITAVVVILIRSEWTELTKFTVTHAVSECWQIVQFFPQQPRLCCVQNVRPSVLYAKARQGPGLPRYISVGVVYSALVCHVNRLGTRHNSLGTEPSIPTTRKDHSAAAIQRHTHPYTDLYTTDTKLLILLKTSRAGGSS